MSSKTKFIICTVVVILIAILFFFLGRNSIEVTTKTEWVKGETIHDSIPIPYPVEVKVPSDPKWLTKLDTVYIDSIVYVKQTIDTTAILADWILSRKYDNVLFDVDTLGKLEVYSTIQYNQLQKMSYAFTPVHKEITKTRKFKVQPFVMVGVNNKWNPSAQGGVFINHFGIAYDITVQQPQQNQNSEFLHSIKIGWKF